MWLKKIELIGFKSFYEKTVLEFGPGVTAIVGPNGCGKSNIVDAVRWAMGEQSLRSLRAKSSEDLIFAGTSEFPPSPFCEVTLVFDNQQGDAPSQFREFSEIEITRRLTREGESEYLINRSRCRLKDIVEFFLGTGLGKQAYSIIEQGEIERILQAKPEEIRALIEEAAGISRYRFRRDEAKRKMEQTRQNLERVRDILLELKRQLNSLSRQAKKAERYRRYKDELKELEVSIFVWRADGIKREISSFSQKIKEKTELIQGLESEFAKIQADEQDKKSRVILLESRLDELNGKSVDIRSELQRLDSEEQFLIEQKSIEQKNIEKRKLEIDELKSNLSRLSQQIEEKSAQKNEIEFELISINADLEAKEKDLIEKRKQFSQLKSSYDEVLKRINVLREELARSDERERAIEQEHKRAERELARLKRRIDELEPHLKDQHQRSFNFNQNLYELKKSLSELDEKLKKKQDELERARALASEQSGRVDEIRSRYQEVRAKLESLAEMIEGLEGFERGVKFVLEKARSQPDKNGVYGLLADVIETQPEYEQAVEAVLGERIQSILVESPERAVEAIEWLKAESAGWSAFVPLKLKCEQNISIPESFREKGARPLIELVQVREGFEKVAEALLGSAVLVKDLNQAFSLWQENNFNGAFVTPEGVVLDPLGILCGGKKDQSGILSKKREYKELNEEKNRLLLRLKSAEQNLSQLKSQVLLLEKELAELKERRHKLELEILTQEKDLKRTTDQLNQYSDQLNKLKEQEKELSELILSFIKEKSELEEKRKLYQNELSSLEQKSAQLDEELKRSETELDELEKEFSSISQERARLKEKLVGLEETRISIISTQEQNEARLKELSREIEQSEQKIQDITARLERIKSLRTELSEQAELIKARYQELEADKNSFEAELAKLAERAKELGENIQRARRELDEISLAKREKELELAHQRQMLKNLYELELDDVYATYIEKISSSEFDPTSCQQRVDELHRLIHRMGEVNPTALEEYQEVLSRYNFLSEQESDLLGALEKLEQTIQRINQEYRRQFKSTFESVNQLFQKLFPKLFGGGKAMLVLNDEGDLLESGIEIIAQPPGKKLQSLSLLSGGEKALCALALIFALYLNRPSPFCLLDEVDASLDEVNIDRFNQMIRELAKNSQMILVTHNKRTMELADIIYGITMERPGISKVVSVKLEEVA